MNGPLVDRFRRGFAPGRTTILDESDGRLVPGLDLDIVVQRAGERLDVTGPKESAWVLLMGAAIVTLAGRDHAVERSSLFHAAPWALHVDGSERAAVHARSERVEWAVVRATNAHRFEPRLFAPGEVTVERRGAGLAHGAFERTVRLVFDRSVRPASELVIGEVACDAGRWSSYPPHSHPQPEAYHYRFTAAQGFGHAELGERVFKVRNYDTLCIPPRHTHAQAAAPGYGMWYLWVVRHLPGAPYAGFEYEPEHTWMLA